MEKTYLGLKKDLWINILIFLSITYVILPIIFSYVARPINLEYNFLSFPAYTLILVVLYGVFNREKLANYHIRVSLKQRLFYFFFALISFYFYFVIKYNSFYNYSNFAGLMILYGALYLLGIIFIALFIFGIKLFKQTYSSLLVFSIVTLIFYAITNVLWQFWDFLAIHVAKLVHFLLSLFSDSTVLNLTDKDPTLGLNNFEVIIGPPCSGIDSLSMYLGLFLLLFVYEMDKLNWKKTGIVFIIGLFGTYLLNIFRVTSLILIGTKYPDFALGMFHSQAGWILFSLFLLVLLYFSYHWMKKK